MEEKTIEELKLMKIAGRINFQTHQLIMNSIKPGITTKELDKKAHDFIVSQGGIPSFLNYQGFPATICTSINDEVVHGIPSNKKLKEGDIISIDIGVIYKGYHSDSAMTHPVGKITKEAQHLLKCTQESLYKGLSKIKNGVHLGDVSNSIEEYALANDLGVIRELVGHGVGKSLHEKPDVPNYGKKGTGIVLKTGMTIAVEPMLTLGKRDIWIEDNDWTISTQDGSLSAHFEHTIVVTEEGYEILTGDDQD